MSRQTCPEWSPRQGALPRGLVLLVQIVIVSRSGVNNGYCLTGIRLADKVRLNNDFPRGGQRMDKVSEFTGASQKINVMNEKPLHAALKEWYCQPGDEVEIAVDNYIIDIVRGNLLIEIQTQNFAALKRKITRLVELYPVRLVYPIVQEKWIVRVEEDGRHLSRRKSPKRGEAADVFKELVSFPGLLSNGNFSLELLFIRAEEVRSRNTKRGWRKKEWVTSELRLLEVVDSLLLGKPADFTAMVPDSIVEPFTTADLAHATGRSRQFARRMAYCLRMTGCLIPTGKQGNTVLYKRNPEL